MDLSDISIGIRTRNQTNSAASIAVLSYQRRAYGSATRMIFADTTVGETVQVPVIPLSLSPMVPPTLDSGFDSASIASFMILPAPRPYIVINPTHPADYLPRGNFVTVQSTSRFQAEVRASVSILSSSQEEITSIEELSFDMAHTQHFLFDGNDMDAIPQESMNQLHDEILARGIPIRAYIVSGDVSRLELVDYTEEWIARLPTIQYTILSETGIPVAFVHLTGNDYVIRPRSGSDVFFLGIRPSRIPKFGYNFLSSIATFVDNRNQMIGFGES